MDHFLHEECFYCGMEMVGYGRDAPTPSADDDEEWQRLAFFQPTTASGSQRGHTGSPRRTTSNLIGSI